MPKGSSSNPQIHFVVQKDGGHRGARIIDRSHGECYVHYVDGEPHMDEWIPEDRCLLASDVSSTAPLADANPKKRKRGRTKRIPSQGPSIAEQTGESSSSVSTPHPQPIQSQSDLPALQEEDPGPKKQLINSKKNFDDVFFGDWKIKTWYFSPYPLTDEIEEIPPGSAMARTYKAPAVSRAVPRSHTRTTDIHEGVMTKQHDSEPANLWVCDRCFKYFTEGVVWEVHQSACDKTPPGRKVYNRDPLTIWEIDGAEEKLYCQNLSLFGKLFIDIKTLFFDLDNFMFYVLTTGLGKREHIIGYFSKEKISFDDYNLACIVTFPQHQRQGYGMLLIEFSYELSRRVGKVGTPERPLSDLGLRGYLSYWVATIIRFFRRVLSVLPPSTKGLVMSTNNFPDVTTLQPEALAWKRKNAIDLQVEIPTVTTPLDLLDDPIFTTNRTYATKPLPDGGAETHVHISCTLEDIARATNLRVDDAAFALNECGLLMKRYGERSERDGEEAGTVIITRGMVEAVVNERKVKRMVLDLNCVLLDG